MQTDRRISLVLFLNRLSVFLVMLLWTLDKFLNPTHAARVMEQFYFLSGVSQTLLSMVGVTELVILVGFLIGYQKRITYGAVLLFHLVSTLSTAKFFLAPFSNLLYFAGWPMLAACVALYSLRDLDTIAVS
ncbi:MAG: hypothetical protein HY712_03690 [candidate division NC10 bacterium]|nr:hypothetical protein [candidate division NC10 bacterium]